MAFDLLRVLATVAAMGPTKLVLAVVAAVVVAVVAAIVAAVFQRHVVPGAIPYGLNVPVGGTEPRVLDGRCSVSIQFTIVSKFRLTDLLPFLTKIFGLGDHVGTRKDTLARAP